jgi:hypothetical protein
MSVTVTTASGAVDDLRALRSWLVGDDELRGRVTLAEQPIPADKLGGLTEALVVAVGPGAGLTALASIVIAWLRSRGGTATCKLTRADGTTFEVTAEQVNGLDAAALDTMVQQVSKAMTYESTTN